jgi:class 3 adenylate cyclase
VPRKLKKARYEQKSTIVSASRPRVTLHPMVAARRVGSRSDSRTSRRRRPTGAAPPAHNDAIGTHVAPFPDGRRIKETIMMKCMMAAAFALALAVGFAPTAPLEAQTTQTGLVNVAIGDIETGDILSNNRVAVGVAANIAANVCGVTAQVGVIAEQIARTGNFRCENQQTGRFVQVTS